MGRNATPVKTVPIKITTTAVLAKYLDALVDSGLYGKSRTEAAERLVAKGVEALIQEGTLLKADKATINPS